MELFYYVTKDLKSTLCCKEEIDNEEYIKISKEQYNNIKNDKLTKSKIFVKKV